MPVQFQDNSINIKAALNQEAIAFLYEVGGELVDEVQNNSRGDKGDTQRAWDYVVDEAEGVCTVGNPLENAIWEEFGTGEYALHGDGRKDAWYVPVDGYTGKKKPTYNGKVVIVYGKEGKQYYKTNGKKPTRALETAFNTMKPAIIKEAQRRFGTRFNE